MSTPIKVSKFTRLLFHYNWEVVEIIGGISKILCGIWLMLPFSTFYGTPIYTSMASVLPEWSWGLAMVIIGAIHLYILGYSNSLTLRTRMALFAIMFWIFLAIIFAIGRVGSLLVPLTAIFPVFLTINYLRLKVPYILSRYTGHI